MLRITRAIDPARYPLAHALRSGRVERNLSVRKAAKLAKISAAYLSDLELAKRLGASRTTLAALAKALRLDKLELLRLADQQRVVQIRADIADLERRSA
jgi:transcriptional regulator with XRE-family HTH domain